MTIFPMYLSTYPNMDTTFPFHLSINEIKSSFPSHRHDYLEFSLVIEGQGHEVINGKKHEMEAGTFTFILPYQIHEIVAEKDRPLILFNCIFDLGLIHDIGLQGLLSETGESELNPYLKLNDEYFYKIKRNLEEMYEEYNGNKPYKEIVIKAKLTEVLILFERNRKGKQIHSISNNHSAKKGIIWDIIQYIHLHYQEDITLSKLAKQFHVSVPYLSELFKEHVGLNFVHFLHEIRIRHACSLLTSTTIPVTEIALEVGYQSFQTFSRVFKEQKKISPSAFRKINNGQGKQ
ncbi:AraC family transcriptional regulator [Metabacillus sp. Hm71]|uniref:AraC family transcriptional regulator n=1 Tax=Metabacillus sp. Hm71 TaxID=3450743 RepID=UPI003F43B097